MTKSSEQARIELLTEIFQSRTIPSQALVGIGDDAAVLPPCQDKLVWTIDTQVEGVHFRRDLVSMHDLGYRATMAAVSDLGAMGASALGILAALVLPEGLDDSALSAIASGQAEAASAVGTNVIGGNLSRGRELSITTTVLGQTPRPLLRSGARVGDVVALAGSLGLAAAGLCLLERGLAQEADAAPAIAAFRRPIARIAAGLRARDQANAAIDVSDGLVRDLGHVARASGVSMGLFEDKLITEELKRAARLLDKDPVSLALYGGEDYAIVIAVPEGQTPAGFEPIGIVLACEGREPCVGLLADEPRRLVPLRDAGFDHFS